MGFFDLKATCGCCGKTCGLNCVVCAKVYMHCKEKCDV